MKRSWWKAILEGGVGFLVLVLWCNIAAWAQVAPAPVEEAAEKEARPEEVAKPPPLLPEEPGYIAGILPPYPYATLEAGPTTGVLAPYGYAPAYDTLLRGWRAHRVGPVLVSPYLEYNGIYRSNIFQTSTDRRSDFVNAVFPSLRLELPVAGRHKVSVGYLGNYFIYSENDRQSHYDHNVNADIAVNFRGGLSLRLGNTFRAATEERTAETGRQRDYRRLNPYFLATYAFADRWKLQGSYLFDYLDFAEAVDRVNEYREHTGGLTLYYKFWPKTSALVQYIITAREYPFSPRGDNVSHSPLVGLTWDPTAKLTGTVKFGYTVKKYDRDLPGRDNSPDSWAMSLQTLYRYSRYTTLTLTAQRSIQEDVDLAANNAYRNTAVYVSWNHEWHYFRSLVYLTFGYSKNHYLGPTLDPLSGERKSREDDLLSLGGGLSRPFTRFFRVRLDYQYLDRSSNLGGFSYNEHRFLCGIQASL